MSDVNDNDEVFLGFELASCRGSIGSSHARYADGGGCEGNSESTGHKFFFRRVHRACWAPTLMPRLDERRRGEPCDEAPSSLVRCADCRLARIQTVQELDDRAPFHCSVPSPPRLGTKEIAQATAMLRNFKPVDDADGSFGPFLQQE